MLKFFKFFLLLLFCDFISCEGYFTVIGSKLLKHKSKYHVSITSQGYETPQVLEVTIRNSKRDEKSFEISKNVTLSDEKIQQIVFDLKDQPVGNYDLQVKGTNFEKFKKLHMNTKQYSVFVQTDKSIYKPADKVQFRVIILDADMRAIANRKLQVHISDGAQNRVKQFVDVNLSKGFFQNELQLSDSPVLGSWVIHVKLDGVEATAKQFEVAEYTLPKFEVTIDANPNANFKDGKIRAAVKAKYTFGKLATGNATIIAEVAKHWWYGQNSEPSVKVTKSINVDGKAPIDFDIENELGIKEQTREETVELTAVFREELTGREMNASATVKIHLTPHKIELEKSSSSFKPGLPFFVEACVKLHDKGAPVDDKKNPLKFKINFHYDILRTCQRQKVVNGTLEDYECAEGLSYEKNEEVYIENGVARLDIDIPLNTTRIDVTAKYFETEKSLWYVQRAESESNQFIQIKATTVKPKFSKNVKIEVLATDVLAQLTYQVIGRGEVIASETVLVPNVKKFEIEFKATLAMVPKSKVVVFYLTSDGEIISDSLELQFDNELRNFIDVELSKNQTKPGENIDISISTNPNSFVGLLGVDQSVLLLKKGNDIEQSNVFEEIEGYNQIDEYNSEWSRDYDYSSFTDFYKSEAVIITNAKKEFYRPYIPAYHAEPYFIREHIYAYDLEGEMDSDRVFDSAPESGIQFSARGGPQVRPAQEVTIRKTFPETWLFDNLEFNSKTTSIKLSKKVPDTITSWIITGFSIDPETGLGLTKQPSKFTIFQPFFVSTNLPYSIKRGEVVSIPISVFNYMEDDQEAEVTLFNTEGEFEFAEVNEAENQVRRRKRALESQRKKKVIVKSQSGTSVPFMIRPLKVGHITIKVVATSAIAGDGVERQLIVEPEGVTKYMNKALFIDLRTDPEFKSNISISIPPNAVPDSTKIEVSAIGDILGPSIENLDKLIKLPYGCGEQNMLNFVPNIVVLDYLTTLKKLTPEIESKTIKFMESGYQRELTYKHDDGSYSAFGKSDESGSTWLTAFVAKSFRQAAKHIMVDEEIIVQALDFLSKVQTPNGSFPEVGHVSHKDMQGGSSNGIALTAYTLITFLENPSLIKKYQNTIDKALSFIHENLEELDDNYSLAIASYAMQLAKDSLKDSLLKKLDSKSENKNGLKNWEKKVPKSDESSPWHHRPNSVNVEMSAYALQAFIEAGQDTEAVPIMKWLVTQRNKNGGFQSTQDTVVGLQALSKLAMKIYVPDSKIDIALTHIDGSTTNLNLNDENALILQKHELPSKARNFDVTARGHGFSILQLSYKYNMNVTGEWPRFVLEPELNKNSNKDFLHLSVCTSFVPDDTADKSNMAVMEVSLPSGYTFDTDTLAELKSTEKVKKVETKDGETIVVVYFDDISSKKICPQFKAFRTHSVAKQKPAPVIVYDYYDNSRRATSFYNAPEVSLCDICDGAEECKADCEQMEINLV